MHAELDGPCVSVESREVAVMREADDSASTGGDGGGGEGGGGEGGGEGGSGKDGGELDSMHMLLWRLLPLRKLAVVEPAIHLQLRLAVCA